MEEQTFCPKINGKCKGSKCICFGFRENMNVDQPYCKLFDCDINEDLNKQHEAAFVAVSIPQ